MGSGDEKHGFYPYPIKLPCGMQATVIVPLIHHEPERLIGATMLSQPLYEGLVVGMKTRLSIHYPQE
jgi:hypothetical protein